MLRLSTIPEKVIFRRHREGQQYPSHTRGCEIFEKIKKKEKNKKKKKERKKRKEKKEAEKWGWQGTEQLSWVRTKSVQDGILPPHGEE